jgi:uncharacterized membrane protein (UPF0127 family)
VTPTFELRNVTLGHVLAKRVVNANSLWRRFVGLLAYMHVDPDQGMWFDRTTSIHTIGMRTTVDVIFLDAECRVVDVRASVPPNRPLVWNPRAKSIVELGAAVSRRTDIRVGDKLALEPQ